MQEQLLHCYLFGDDTVGVAIPALSFLCGLQSHGFDVAFEDCLVAHHPYHFIDDG